MGVPLNHPFLFGMFPYKPSSNYWGTPMTMETSISIHFYTHHLAIILYNHIIQYYTPLITIIRLHPSYTHHIPTHHIPIIYPSCTHHIPISHSSLGPVCFFSFQASPGRSLPRSSACWPHPPHGTLVHRRCFWSETTGESIEKPNMLEKWLFFSW